MVSDQYYEFGSAATRTLIFLNLAFLFQQQKTMLVSDGKNSDPTGTNTTDVRAAYVGRLTDPSKNDFFWTLAKFYSWLLFFFSRTQVLWKYKRLILTWHQITVSTPTTPTEYGFHPPSSLNQTFCRRFLEHQVNIFSPKYPSGSIYPFSWKGSSFEVDSSRISQFSPVLKTP